MVLLKVTIINTDKPHIFYTAQCTPVMELWTTKLINTLLDLVDMRALCNPKFTTAATYVIDPGV